jgi:hypothetical protein
MRRLSVAILAVMATGCEARGPQSALDTLVPMALGEVREQMRDPNSSTFDSLVGRETPQAAVCGRVNGRNAFGGYAGPQRFIRLFTGAELAYAQALVNATDEDRQLAEAALATDRALRETRRFATDSQPSEEVAGLWFEPETDPIDWEILWLRHCSQAAPLPDSAPQTR